MVVELASYKVVELLPAGWADAVSAGGSNFTTFQLSNFSTIYQSPPFIEGRLKIVGQGGVELKPLLRAGMNEAE